MERLGTRQAGNESGPIFRHTPMRTKEFTSLLPDQKKRIVEETALDTLTHLAQAGYQEYASINGLFRDLKEPGFIVRRENPERLLSSISAHTPLTVDFPTGERYSNAVEWDTAFRIDSMNNAFFEGYGMANGIVTVVGVRSEGLDIARLPDAQSNFYGINRESVVSIKGAISPNNIIFVIVRIPIYGYPVEMMTEEERDMFEDWDEARHKATNRRVEPKFIYRGYLNTKSQQRATLH